jgi:XTP/dITP diphosphohydrolase
VTTFVLATANPHKVVEMRAVLEALDIAVSPRPEDAPEVDETEDTLEGNALLKARALCALTGEPAVADDTGLFVDALGGRPGVHSARFAGPRASYADNVAKLLDELSGVPAEARTARFTTVIAVAYPDGEWFCAQGVLEGLITETPRGDGGFGYDPIFAPVGWSGRTLAELTAPEKNADSHRARALRSFADALARR